MASFQELGVKEEFIRALKELNIQSPTEIQQKAIPFLLTKEANFIGQAQTGTGKTVAFGLPLLHRVDSKSVHVQGLVLTSTRELAQQIAKQLFKFTKYSEKIFVEAVYGGAKIDEQINALRRPTQIIVATPGRLLDLLDRKAVDLNHIRTVILDEADEMLSMGFKDELDKILQYTRNNRAIWLFSATIPATLKQIINSYMADDTYTISVDKKQVVNAAIDHQYILKGMDEKLNFLTSFLEAQGTTRGIVFCKTKAATQTLAKQLQSKNCLADAIHGDLKQLERDKVMRAFKNHKTQILVATDISARGIDVEDLSYIVHYQLPEQQEYYIHRSGRTARAGKRGLSLSLVLPQEQKRFLQMCKELNIYVKEYKPAW